MMAGSADRVRNKLRHGRRVSFLNQYQCACEPDPGVFHHWTGVVSTLASPTQTACPDNQCAEGRLNLWLIDEQPVGERWGPERRKVFVSVMRRSTAPDSSP